MPTFPNSSTSHAHSGNALRAFVLSIRPTYIERILDGRKTIELRRRFPTEIGAAALVLLYSTSPVQAIVGSARLTAVSQRSLRALWREFGTEAAVTRSEFDAYFSGAGQGCALRLTDVHEFESPIHLTDLAREFEFSPPQSYCYWKEPLSRLATHGRVKATT
jgi:predicted transcriptional regulator